MAKQVTNKRQMERLVDIMKCNPNIAKGQYKKSAIIGKWSKYTEELNSLGPPTKSSEKWLKVWTDYKFKLKKKLNKMQISETDGGPNNLQPLNRLEEAAAEFLEIHSNINPPGVNVELTATANYLGTTRNESEANIPNSEEQDNNDVIISEFVIPDMNLPYLNNFQNSENNLSDNTRISNGQRNRNNSSSSFGRLNLLKSQTENMSEFHNLIDEMQKISWRKWCIACGKQNDSDLDIDLCSKDVGTAASTVFKYLQLVVPDETKFYSGKICITCYRTISFIIQFNNHVAKVQKMLLELEKHGYDENILESLQKKFGVISQPGADESNKCPNEEGDIKPIIEDETAITVSSTYQSSPNAIFVIENNTVLDNSAAETVTENEICDSLNSGEENYIDNDSPDAKSEFKCSKCQKEFKLKRYMDNHFRRVHKNNKSFKCNICNENFETKKSLKEHSVLHKEERKHKCPECKKAFKHKQDLKVHSAIHDGIGCICQICGVKCKTQNVLRSHMIVHSDTKKYKCNFCSKEFKRSKEFKYHLILHTGLKPYQCPFCELKFPNRPNCRKHQKRVHPKELAEEELKGQPKFFKAIPSINELNELVIKKEC